jgi:hypothetical protein
MAPVSPELAQACGHVVAEALEQPPQGQLRETLAQELRNHLNLI